MFSSCIVISRKIVHGLQEIISVRKKGIGNHILLQSKMAALILNLLKP